MNHEITIGNLQLRNPLVLLSGTAGYGIEMKGLVDIKKLGGIVAKTVTLEPKAGNKPPRITEVYGGVVNAIGLENPGIDVFMQKYWPQVVKLPTSVILSIGGHSEEEFVACFERFKDDPTVKAVELNLSCPNVRAKKLISQDEEMTASLITRLKKMTKASIIAKLTPQVNDITAIARAASDAGADALCLVNTFPAMRIDINKRKPALGNVYGGLAGRCVKPMAVRAVHLCAKAVKTPIIASGGVYSWEDAVEFIMAGATAVGIGTANFTYPDIAERVMKGMDAYAKKHKLASWADIRGIV